MMTPKNSAFYSSLEEMKNSYQSDLRMIANYKKADQHGFTHATGDHVELLQNQLRLIVDTIDQLMKLR